MIVLGLTWSSGDNNPFDFAFEQLKLHYRSVGKEFMIIDIATDTWINSAMKLFGQGVEYAYCSQGLAADKNVILKDGRSVNLWEYFKIPLICWHADHPSYMPTNHSIENNYIHHVYIDPEFSLFSNKHFRRKFGAISMQPPNLLSEANLREFSGKHFSLIRNYVPLEHIKNRWLSMFDDRYRKILYDVEDIITCKLSTDGFCNMHSELDDVLDQHQLLIAERGSQILFHLLHNQIDRSYRNKKTALVVKSLCDYPLRIYGAGWDQMHLSKYHQHFQGMDAKSSQALYYSEYGIIDISPMNFMHDRSLRAIHNQTAFITDAKNPLTSLQNNEFNSIFYDLSSTHLINACELVMKNPKQHLKKCIEFSKAYQLHFPANQFLINLNSIAHHSKP